MLFIIKMFDEFRIQNQNYLRITQTNYKSYLFKKCDHFLIYLIIFFNLFNKNLFIFLKNFQR